MIDGMEWNGKQHYEIEWNNIRSNNLRSTVRFVQTRQKERASTTNGTIGRARIPLSRPSTRQSNDTSRAAVLYLLSI